jgi:ABC-type polysaccharide/polyol phosphate transport system ATPase subunit
MDILKQYCDQAAVLEAGKLTIYGSVDEAVRHYHRN